MNDTILIIEDEESIAGLIEVYLKNEDYCVLKAGTGEDALEMAAGSEIDLALLDLMLPGINGFEVCRRLRETYTFPIIMLTSKDEATDKITGLSLGADDYITKPFLAPELIARVKAQLRRRQKYDASQIPKTENIYEILGLVVDVESHTCTVDNRLIALTPTEFEILRILCERRGKPVNSEDLYREVWGESYYDGGNNTVMVHIRHLREKLGDDGEKPRYIKTVWGVGYKIDACI